MPETERAQRLSDERQREAYHDYLRREKLAQSEASFARDQHTGWNVVVPFMDSRIEVYTPVVEQVQPQRVMVKNLPPKNEHGVYQHGPECRCWLYDEDAAEHVPVDGSILVGVA